MDKVIVFRKYRPQGASSGWLEMNVPDHVTMSTVKHWLDQYGHTRDVFRVMRVREVCDFKIEAVPIEAVKIEAVKIEGCSL